MMAILLLSMNSSGAVCIPNPERRRGAWENIQARHNDCNHSNYKLDFILPGIYKEKNKKRVCGVPVRGLPGSERADKFSAGVCLIPTVMSNDRWLPSQISVNPLKKRKFEKGPMSSCPRPCYFTDSNLASACRDHPSAGGSKLLPASRKRGIIKNCAARFVSWSSFCRTGLIQKLRIKFHGFFIKFRGLFRHHNRERRYFIIVKGVTFFPGA